jgi:hypothetical protein
MIPTWAVVPTKNRPQLVRDLLSTLAGQVVGAVVVDNNDAVDEFEIPGIDVMCHLHRPGYPPNISQLLNAGLDVIYGARTSAIVQRPQLVHGEFNVALLNDDVRCPPGWVESLSSAMRATTAVMAYTDRQARREPMLYTEPPRSPFDTATVCACLLRGETHLLLDETMKWWYSDTDLDYRCRQIGGVLAVPGPIPEHLFPSVQTFSDPVLSAQTHRDRERFDAKWQGVPW